MKIASVIVNGTQSLAVPGLTPDEVVVLNDVPRIAGSVAYKTDLKEVISDGLEDLIALVADLKPAEVSDASVNVTDVTWLPPVPAPGKVLGVAMNNGRLNSSAHVEPAGPMFFLKPSSSLIGHNETIEIGDDYGLTFPELELAVVIGTTGKNIAMGDALSHIAGYVIMNDVTSQGLKGGDSIAVEVPSEKRSLEGYDHYFNYRRTAGPEDLSVYLTYHGRSKGADTFGPMGPWFVSADEIEDPDALDIRGYVDGELFAEDSTSAYSHSVTKIVSWASRYFTLQAGDVITCGTSAKGNEQYPYGHHNIDLSRMTPRIDIDIEGLGRLTSFVRHVKTGR